jgi:hypothetical protein
MNGIAKGRKTATEPPIASPKITSHIQPDL